MGSESASAAPEASGDEQAEIDQLRAEVEELRRAAGQQGSPTPDRLADPGGHVLIVLGCVLAPLSVLGVWSANQVSDTNRYIANIEPLIHDPAVQNALTDKITIQITSHLNVTGYTNQAAALLTSKGLTRVGALLQDVRPVDRQRGRRVHPQPGAQDRDQPAVRQHLDPGQHRGPRRSW